MLRFGVHDELGFFGRSRTLFGDSGTQRLDRFDRNAAVTTTVLAEHDIITALHIPQMTTAARWGYYKFCRKTGEFAEASCAAYFEPATGSAQIVVGALDGAPVALNELAAHVAQSGVSVASDAVIDAALTASIAQLDILGRRMAATAVKRCLEQAFGLRVAA